MSKMVLESVASEKYHLSGESRPTEPWVETENTTEEGRKKKQGGDKDEQGNEVVWKIEYLDSGRLQARMDALSPLIKSNLLQPGGHMTPDAVGKATRLPALAPSRGFSWSLDAAAPGSVGDNPPVVVGGPTPSTTPIGSGGDNPQVIVGGQPHQ